MSISHLFNIEHAKKYGVNEAIFLSNLIFWITQNRANKKQSFEGRTWTYNSYSAFSELFPYWSKQQVRRIVQSLREQKVIITRQEEGEKRNNGLFYALEIEGDFMPKIEKGVSKSADGVSKSADHSINTYSKPDEDIGHSENDHDSDNLFSEFKKVYPRKVKWDRAIKVWNKKKLWRYWDEIKINIEQRKKVQMHWHECPGKQIQFVPHPTSYLNDSSWNDPLELTHKDCKVCSKNKEEQKQPANYSF